MMPPCCLRSNLQLRQQGTRDLSQGHRRRDLVALALGGAGGVVYAGGVVGSNSGTVATSYNELGSVTATSGAGGNGAAARNRRLALADESA